MQNGAIPTTGHVNRHSSSAMAGLVQREGHTTAVTRGRCTFQYFLRQK